MPILLSDLRTSLTEICTGSDLQITVTDASRLLNLPDGDINTSGNYISLTLKNGTLYEYCNATAVNGNVITIVRAQGNTLARRWPVGTLVIASDPPYALKSYVENKAVTLSDQDDAVIEQKVTERVENDIKDYAKDGNQAKIPFSDLESTQNLESIDELEDNDELIAQTYSDSEIKKVSPGVISVRVKNDILPDPEPNKYLGWDTDGEELENKDAPTGGGTGINESDIRGFAKVNNPSGDKLQPSQRLAHPASTATHLQDSNFVGILGYYSSDNASFRGMGIDDIRRIFKTITTSERDKLTNIEANATRDQTPAEIKTALESLQDTNRLNASAIQGLPSGGGGSQNASEVPTSTTDFNNALSDSDNTVQKALDTLDDKTPTASDIENIVHKESQAPLEQLAQFSNLTGALNDAVGAESDESRIGAGTFVDNLGSLTVNDSVFILRRIVTDPSDGLLSVVLSTVDGNNNTNAAKLNNVTVDINGSRANLGKATIVTASNYISYDFRFRGSDDPIKRDSTNVVTFYESLSSESYVSRDSVYKQDKEIIQGGEGIGVNADDEDKTVTTSIDINRIESNLQNNDEILYHRRAGNLYFRVTKPNVKAWLDVGHSLQTGTAFPNNPATGDRILILRPTTESEDRQFEVTQPQRTLREILFGTTNGPSRIYAYSSDYTGSGHTVLANNVVINTAGVPTKTMDKLVFHSDRYRPVEYTINRAIVPAFQHTYLVQNFNYPDVVAGQRYYINIIFTDGTKLFPDRQIPIADYSFDGTDWIYTPGVAAPWATQGQPEPRTLLSVESLSATNIGINTTNSSQRRFGTFQAFTRHDGSNFDLNDNPTGIVETQVRATIVSRSDNQIGFAQNYNSATNPSIDRSGFTSISKIGTFETARDSGFEIFEQDIYRGTTLIDKVRFAISKNANPYLGYNLRLSGEAGGYNYTVAVSVNTFILHNDGPGATNFLGLVDTPNDYEGQAGKPLVANSDEDGLVFGGGPVFINESPSAAVTCTPNTEADIVTLPAITADQIGTLTLVGQVNFVQSGLPNDRGGGVSLTLKRLRNSATTVIDSFRYGVTVGPTYGGMDDEIIFPVEAQTGDVYSLHTTVYWSGTDTVDAGTDSKLVAYRT